MAFENRLMKKIPALEENIVCGSIAAAPPAATDALINVLLSIFFVI